MTDVVPLQGARLWGSGRHCWVPLQGAIVDVVPLLGAIAGCHSSVLWLGVGDDQLWRVDVVPSALQGANLCLHFFLLYSGPPTSRKQQWILF